MEKFSFWNLWRKPEKFLYLFILFIFCLVGVYYIISWFVGNSAVIGWEIAGHWEKFSVVADQFQVALFNLEVLADNYVTTETFLGSTLKVNHTAAKIFMVLLGVGLSLLVAFISALPRFWYILGMGAFIFFINNFKFEQLLLFGRGDFTGTIVIFLLYIPLSYFFHGLRPDVRFYLRSLSFLAITVITGVLVHYFATIEHPWLYLASYGLSGPVVLSILFIFLVGHEVIAAFLLLITSYNTAFSKNSVWHFVALSAIYLINILFAYLHNAGMIQWDIFYLNAFWVLLASALLGIWGFRKRSVQFDNMIPMNGPGEIMFLALGMICFATISYLHQTANDPILETFEDAIIFSQFGFGLFFFIYVLVNFLTLLMQNARVHKVVYKPIRMPFSMANLGGFAIVILFFFRSGIFPYYQAVAGYYNGIGDVYSAGDDYFLAEQYYKLASGYEFQNHRSNYSLASLAVKQQDQAAALFYFKQSLIKQPSEFGYINLANIYRDNSRIFDAVFSLKEGLRTFPESGPIKNNLALLYDRLDLQDSAFIFLNEAVQDKVSRESAQANALALYARSKGTPDMNSIPETFKNTEYIPAISNWLVIQNKNNQPAEIPLKERVFQDTVLNLNNFSYLNNYTFNSINRTEATEVDTLLKHLVNHPSNISFQEPLDFLRSFHAYYHNEVGFAVKNLNEMQVNATGASGYYNYVLGAWTLEQGAPQLAAQFFDAAYNKNIEEGLILSGVALSLSKKQYAAREFWSSLVYEKNEDIVSTSSEMLRTLNLDRDLTVSEMNESFSYRALLIHFSGLSEPEINDFLDDIHTEELKSSALKYIIRHYLNSGNTEQAGKFLEKLETLSLSEEVTEVSWLKAEVSAERDEAEFISSKFKDLKPQTRYQQILHLYFQAIWEDKDGNKERAKELYSSLISKNPFFTRGVVRGYQYIKENTEGLQAYDMLLQALEINNTSIQLHKHYILEALESGLSNFAESALEELKDLTTPEDFKNFLKIYESKVLELKQKNDGWG